MATFLKEAGWEELARQLGEATERYMSPVIFGNHEFRFMLASGVPARRYFKTG
jgi:hypothetical protein